MLKFFRFFLVFALLCVWAVPVEAETKSKSKSKSRKHRVVKTQHFTATSGFLWNITQDKIYFQRNADQRVYPASTTKVMTALLALERLPLDQYVTVSARAAQVQPSKLDVRSGEQYLVRDLIYACLLKSANDASNVLAEAVAGSQSKFVDLMNQKAKYIGAKNTKFANAHGLPSSQEQYTTARDMAVIFKEALKNPFFEKALSYREKNIYSKAGRRHYLKSHNKALFLKWKQNVVGKTGYTRQARSCFVGTFNKGKDQFIVDVFGCWTNQRWNDVKWMIENKAGVKL